jgi:hypothetical protein
MIGFKQYSSSTGASQPPPSQLSIVSDSSYSTETPTEKCQPPPWQVKWKRPRLDRVVLGIDSPDNNDECACDDFFEDNRDDWIPISSSSVALTRNEARMAILELHKRDKLLVKKAVSSGSSYSHSIDVYVHYLCFVLLSMRLSVCGFDIVSFWFKAWSLQISRVSSYMPFTLFTETTTGDCRIERRNRAEMQECPNTRKNSH